MDLKTTKQALDDERNKNAELEKKLEEAQACVRRYDVRYSLLESIKYRQADEIKSQCKLIDALKAEVVRYASDVLKSVNNDYSLRVAAEKCEQQRVEFELIKQQMQCKIDSLGVENKRLSHQNLSPSWAENLSSLLISINDGAGCSQCTMAVARADELQIELSGFHASYTRQREEFDKIRKLLEQQITLLTNDLSKKQQVVATQSGVLQQQTGESAGMIQVQQQLNNLTAEVDALKADMKKGDAKTDRLEAKVDQTIGLVSATIAAAGEMIGHGIVQSAIASHLSDDSKAILPKGAIKFNAKEMTIVRGGVSFQGILYCVEDISGTKYCIPA